MADIDDELLALAGGGSDGEDNSPRSPSPESSASGRKRRRSRSRSRSPPRRARRDDSEEEEGEARSSAPGSPDSQQSVPMDESDSDAEPAPSKSFSRDAIGVDEEYPIEGLYRSHAEKAEISRMVEVERETILAERREHMERFKQNRVLRQLVSQRESGDRGGSGPGSATGKRSKRSAGDADLDNSDSDFGADTRPRGRSARSKASDKMDDYRRARAEKVDRMRRLKEDRERARDSNSSRNYDAYDDDNEGDSWHRRSPTPEVKSRRQPELNDFERLRISRAGFAQICFKPQFEESVIDCYVRVLGKPDRNTGEQQYHMLSIKGITAGKPYAMQDARGSNSFVTEQYVVAGLGKRTETYPFVAISSGKLTESELQKHKDALANMGLNTPRMAVLEDRLAALNKLVKYELNNKEITEMVERKNQLRRRVDPAQREALQRSIAEAEDAGNMIMARQLQEDLDALGSSTGLAFRTSLNPKASSSPGAHRIQQEKMAELNRLNRKKNVEAVRRAQLKERQRIRDLEAAAARGEVVQEDLSRRLKTKAKFVHDVNDGGLGGNLKAGDTGTAKDAAAAANDGLSRPVLQIAQAVSNGIPTVHRPVQEDDIIAGLDMDIDVEID
ncbi:RNA polymerase-associated protein RTF1 [Ceratocystis platani]|uniref:RNA polymerase-associated protein RTF1 n=1 Tax=Ceratocystis fimbriata f. sp. platani TaxID=88771 RepID=A0A0F8CR75_CERFI|nr:RNA polymerase-associated protein RTF1 [Ceratocystis platani]